MASAGEALRTGMAGADMAARFYAGGLARKASFAFLYRPFTSFALL
jgi:hypothetical protein